MHALIPARFTDRPDLEQISTLLRYVADVQPVSIYATKATVTVNGAAAQVAMCCWLIEQLDLPPGEAPSSTREYRAPTRGNDLVRVFYVTHAPEARQVSMIATNVRTLGDFGQYSSITRFGRSR